MKAAHFIIAFLMIYTNAFAKIDLNPEQIQAVITNIQKTHQLPGIQASIKDTEMGDFWNFSSGYRDKETLEPLENNHLMQIGSTTKSFIASLALLLEADSESGSLGFKFDIDQTVGDWLPQYPEWKDVKIKNLLNMTSGIFTEDNSLFKDRNRVWQDNELVALAYPHTLFPWGTKYSYSNTNYILVGMILEKVSGLSLEELITERILKKHFKYTSYAPKTYPQGKMQNMAHGYAMDAKKHPDFYGQDITDISLSWAGAAGALISTASDLANWPTLLFSDNFLPKKQREELESLVNMDSDCAACPLPKDSKSMGYGLGIARLYDPDYGYIWTHNGGTLGYHTLFMYLPEKSMVISIIVNQIGPEIDGEPDVILIAQQILDEIKLSEDSVGMPLNIL